MSAESALLSVRPCPGQRLQGRSRQHNRPGERTGRTKQLGPTSSKPRPQVRGSWPPKEATPRTTNASDRGEGAPGEPPGHQRPALREPAGLLPSACAVSARRESQAATASAGKAEVFREALQRVARGAVKTGDLAA